MSKTPNHPAANRAAFFHGVIRSAIKRNTKSFSTANAAMAGLDLSAAMAPTSKILFTSVRCAMRGSIRTVLKTT